MFVDLVRAGNDAATLGFVSNAGRLNVLITRQSVGLFIVADETCVLTLGQQAGLNDPVESGNPQPASGEQAQKSKEDKRNATVIAISNWMREKGRVVNIAKKSLEEEFIGFPKQDPNLDYQILDWNEEEAADDDKHTDSKQATPSTGA